MELLLSSLSFYYVPCVILLVSFLSFLRHLLVANSGRNLPPGPRPLPLIGNILDLDGAQPHRSMARLAERHGPLMTLRLGGAVTIVASSVDAARDVLQRHDAALSARSAPDIVRACAHDRFSMAWLPPSSPRWRALRKVCSAELFAPRLLGSQPQRHLRREKARRLVSHVARLAAAARVGGRVDVRRVVLTTLLNMLSSTVFSADLADLDNHGGSEFGDKLAEFASSVGVPNMSDYFPVVAPLDPQRLRRRLARVLSRLHAEFDEQIERRMRERAAGAPPKNDFLDVLLDYRSTEDGREFDRQTLRSLLTDLFTAAGDTNAITIERAMTELLRNPSSMAIAREELTQVIGTKPDLEESDISQLKYLKAVVKETLRLHPPVPFLLPRQAEKSIEIGGYTVPKGAKVLVNVWAIGHDNVVWLDPDKFMPERFLQSEVDFRGRHFELTPFGSGRRICPGLPLADHMVHLTLASLLHWFEWRLPPEVEKNGVDMAEKLGVILQLVTPLQAIATPISY
uniref:Cytochrome P450 n=1 Tax=Oryza punctata TaxID=4537 RepID=A0A0E0KYM1_ORYPU